MCINSGTRLYPEEITTLITEIVATVVQLKQQRVFYIFKITGSNVPKCKMRLRSSWLAFSIDSAFFTQSRRAYKNTS